MLMTQIKAEGIAIPMELIQQWRDRKAQLDLVVADAQRESADIIRKLDAVAVLAPDLKDQTFVLTAPEATSETPSVISELGKMMAEQKRFFAPADIKKMLRKREGVPTFSDNYFYTALKRATDKNLIRKAGDRYGPPATSSPQGENPGA